MLRIGPIEVEIWIRQALTVAMPDLHLALHANKRRQLVGRLDEWLSYIDATLSAVKPLRNVTGRSAQPAADVENVLVGLERKSICELYCCGKAPGMKIACLSAVGMLNWHSVGNSGRKILMNSKPAIFVIASSVDSYLNDGRHAKKPHCGA